MSNNSRRLVSINDAAAELNVNPRTVRRMIAAGDLTAYRLGSTRVIRVDMAQVEANLRAIPAAK